MFRSVFEVTTRYVDLQPVGMGAFGLVCRSIYLSAAISERLRLSRLR